jgi:glutaredoxin 3
LELLIVELEHAMQTVKIYTTGTCPYCIQAKQLLSQRGVTQLNEVRVDLEAGERQKMMDLTGRRTVPQIFIGATHVGGCDDLVALDSRGGLTALLNTAEAA